MRPRSVGGLEPDDVEQHELVTYYHVASTALCDREEFKYGTQLQKKLMRVTYAVDEFCKAHPDVARKWPYVWLAAEMNHEHGGVPITPDTYLPERKRSR